MTTATATMSPDWLALREPADAAARAVDLVDQLGLAGAPRRPIVVHDLGCGTGSMGRWLAPRLPGPQHWVLYDRDVDLLARAAADPPPPAADGSVTTVETRRRDITRLARGDLAGASLITASALLDLLTADELDRLVATSWRADCPVLLSLSVAGRVELGPSERLDQTIARAFNEHQRRTSGGRQLLGPDAAAVAAGRFRRLGARVLVRGSPWRLGPADAELATEWLRGWLDAAAEQRPELTAEIRDYRRRRRAAAVAGRLSVTVHHLDLLARAPR